MPLVEHRYPLSMVGGRGGSYMRKRERLRLLTEVIFIDVLVCVCQNCMYRFMISY